MYVRMIFYMVLIKNVIRPEHFKNTLSHFVPVRITTQLYTCIWILADIENVDMNAKIGQMGTNLRSKYGMLHVFLTYFF